MRQKHAWKICLVWLTCLFSSGAAALELDSFSGGLVPGSELILFEDVGAELDFEQARAQLSVAGLPWVAPGQPNLGYRRSALWVRVDLNNRFEEPRDWVAYIGFPNLDRVDFYYQDSDGAWQSHAAGSALPFRARHLMHRSINFEFQVPPSEAMSIYFRVESTGSLQFPLALASTTFFASEAQRTLFTSGLYYGLMLMIAIYSLGVWYTSRESGFLYFALVVVFGSLYSLSTQGLAYQYLWPEAPGWANRSTGVFSLIASVAGILFVRSFLNLKSLDHRLDRAARLFAVLAALGVVASLVVASSLVNRMALGFVAVFTLLVTVSGLLAKRRLVRAARFFVSAWTILLIGILLELLQRMGVIIPPLLAYNGIQIATLAAVTVLALGLSDRLQDMMEGYKSAQHDLLRANQLKIDALQQADNVKEEFIANVSHELRTPLTGIIGLAEIMLADRSSDLNASQRETLTLMKVSAQRLSSLVNDVIDFSAIKSGHLSLNKRDVDLKQVCAVVARMTRPLVGDKPIKLAESYPAARIIVEGDEDRLQQVLFNLVANAVKFTPHGTVTIAVEVLELDVRVSVRDTGIGISAAEQSKIFKRFYQIDSDEARQAGGTGLGLSISQRLLELHDSEIVLRSTPGEGSLFYFDLPLKKTLPETKKTGRSATHGSSQDARDVIASKPTELAAAVQATGMSVERRSNQGPLDIDADAIAEGESGSKGARGQMQGKILVVDDEYLNLRIVESHLADQYQLTTALSGAEALEKLSNEKPDLIILDLMMPIMTGYQFCQIVRKRYDSDDLPIVILTAKNRVEDLVKGLSLGANDYITKPFSKEELRIRIDKQFELLNLTHVKRDNQRLSWQLQRYEESEKRLREREQRLAALLDVTGDPLLAIDEAGIVIFINNAAEQLLQVNGESCLQQSVNRVSDQLLPRSPALADAVHFPFNEDRISRPGNTEYFDFELETVSGRFCLLTLSQVDQEFYLLVFETSVARTVSQEQESEAPDTLSLPQIIEEINRNVERTQLLGEYLSQIKPEDLRKHKDLADELGHIDKLITHLSGTLIPDDDDNSELKYREALVKVMQDCHYYWQKVTGESIIDLAEKSRIWSVSIDNGRLRTRSMNRYLSLDKLPANPRWRQVARTAYFVLSKVSADEEARKSLETSVANLQEIVEQKALN
ncbi:7TM diverse intracellular signaling domain-containing protein [Pseudohongiella sp.]|uniref:histidine kinase n=1 Tax=marine sediment metagenome TaxID=412755 RepID=A0A0F9W3Z0_9ZZZZ|nr:7TM diverse intracellular signaling domain-containing protein [Pseudohongiella sp.]HDZ10151.1 response regulator [Pseudohongiella sp.]HEA64318.1 response regulator [Pseudohongiella sp.]